MLAVMTSQTALALPSGDPPAERYWQCVPIARMLSGIEIYGDAHTWWGQAEGRYERGDRPKKGAVLAFQPHGNMRLGHVAAVTKILDDRTLLVTHSNWSPFDGVRGKIERNVRVVDVSEDNDWSRVRVWFAPTREMGGTAWPTHGFIYPNGKAPLDLGGLRVAADAADYRPPETRAPETRAGDDDREIKPTGRLAYLGRVLKKLNKS
jgi:hypothetical protein